MPRGRPKKQSAEVELLPPDENDQIKVREVKHTAQWIEQRPIEESPEEEGEEFDDDATEDRPRRRVKNAREELRKKLRAQGVSPSTNLRLYIEKYLHSDSNTGGSYAETEFCTKYETTEDHILNKDYIDVARRWGAGKYRITIRMQNKIVDAFDQRISATPSGPIIQNVNPADPNSPQVIVQGDGQQAVMPSIKDIMKVQREALKEQLEMAKLMREAYGFAPEQPQQQPRSEEEIIASAIIKQPEVIENVVGSVIKRFGGKGGGDDEPWYADVVKDAVKSGQLAQVVKVAIDSIFGGFKGLFPGGQDNGQTSPTQTETQDATTTPTVAPTQHLSDSNALLSDGVQSVHSERTDGTDNGAPATTTEDQALQLLIDHCRRNAPVRVAYGRLMEYAGLLNEQYPQGSIDDYIDIFAAMPVDEAIAFVKTQPNGEAVASLPHAKEWCAELQRLIKENQEGEE